ncbi:DUF1080 domain-containing protein [Labilibaculum sp. DW002]|uniref:DUF1080 domain-containing protein n=1 Tax=Paralabilibaculum antarcticum TaxID=2912572 RepID=A0ABT5VPH4_9BACT|nr:DUF1080 domain-containing protein [Labilibaculum sp. DW002]MDE5417334.1 DUF1080 domain-containing protein [Labilibaculum sp. DW002]
MKTFFTFLFVSLFTVSFAQKAPTNDFEISKKWQNLLDKNLTNFEVFIGVPHTSVDIDYDHKSANVHKGTPMGLNNDPKKVMSTIEENGEIILKVTGEIYAGLTSLQEFENYHLKAQFKWGEKKWEPRLNAKRDNGILYHCHGKHGAFWNVWMSSLECQIQEDDMGDFVSLVHARAQVRSSKIGKNLYKVTGEDDALLNYGGKGNPGYCHINKSNEKPNGEWNTIEVICYKNQSLHIVNGKVVMVVLNTRKEIDGKELPLTKGKIQLQCEGAEAYYKDVQIKSIKRFPKNFKKEAGL